MTTLPTAASFTNNRCRYDEQTKNEFFSWPDELVGNTRNDRRSVGDFAVDFQVLNVVHV